MCFSTKKQLKLLPMSKTKLRQLKTVFRSGFTTLVLPLITSDEELVAPGALYAGIVVNFRSSMNGYDFQFLGEKRQAKAQRPDFQNPSYSSIIYNEFMVNTGVLAIAIPGRVLFSQVDGVVCT